MQCLAAVMVLGILYPMEVAKQKSLILLCKAQGGMELHRLLQAFRQKRNCNDLIGEISGMLEEIICDE